MQGRLEVGLLAVAMATLVIGAFTGLWLAPADRAMGEVYRILYIHVPAAWIALLAFTGTFGASVVYLFKGSWKADALAEATAEIGVFFAGLLIVLGALWGKPAWGVYWTWDPRLTTSAILLFAFVGYLALRGFVEDPERRATWSAVSAVLIYVDVPILWLSVRWWRSLHQTQSSPATMGESMLWALLVSGTGFLAFFVWCLVVRFRIARERLALELADPPWPVTEGET